MIMIRGSGKWLSLSAVFSRELCEAVKVAAYRVDTSFHMPRPELISTNFLLSYHPPCLLNESTLRS